MKKKILIIEDEPDLAKVLAKHLLSAGYEVMISMDAIYGVAEVRKFAPDLLILDLMLPGGGGLAVLNNMRMSTKSMNIPVIVLTGMQDEVYKKKVLALGVEGYMQKPYDSQTILSEVKRVLGEV